MSQAPGRLVPAIRDRDPEAPLLEHWRLRQIGPVKWERVGRGPWNAASEGLHDTSVAMIERHYSRWISDRMDDLASSAVVSLC
jgi:uncharacterized protein (DUF2249 family)